MPLHIRFRRFALLSLCLTPLAACAHEPASAPKDAPAPHYVLQSANVAYGIATPGKISRYQRDIITPGGPDGAMTPCAKNFDGIMDHLEGLMAAEIEKNNRYAMVGDMGFSATR